MRPLQPNTISVYISVVHLAVHVAVHLSKIFCDRLSLRHTWDSFDPADSRRLYGSLPTCHRAVRCLPLVLSSCVQRFMGALQQLDVQPKTHAW